MATFSLASVINSSNNTLSNAPTTGTTSTSPLNNVSPFSNTNPQNTLNQSPLDNFQNNLLGSPAQPSSDDSNLPFTNIPVNVDGVMRRNIISWFVPQFGVVRMFVNPQNITYNHKKLITKDKTKGGFTLQYWGEDLSTLNISGTTGSSGIEGINALYEIYRAEQYAFDAVGISLEASNAANDLSNNLVNGIGAGLGSLVNSALPSSLQSSDASAAAGGAGLLGGILGLNSPNNNLAARNIPSLASMAFGVEMYYDGWVFRGFFDSMTIREQATDFLINYDMVFYVTQMRGYRTNYFPWSRSPASGPSNYNTPYSYNGNIITG